METETALQKNIGQLPRVLEAVAGEVAKSMRYIAPTMALLALSLSVSACSSSTLNDAPTSSAITINTVVPEKPSSIHSEPEYDTNQKSLSIIIDETGSPDFNPRYAQVAKEYLAIAEKLVLPYATCLPENPPPTTLVFYEGDSIDASMQDNDPEGVDISDVHGFATTINPDDPRIKNSSLGSNIKREWELRGAELNNKEIPITFVNIDKESVEGKLKPVQAAQIGSHEFLHLIKILCESSKKSDEENFSMSTIDLSNISEGLYAYVYAGNISSTLGLVMNQDITVDGFTFREGKSYDISNFEEPAAQAILDATNQVFQAGGKLDANQIQISPSSFLGATYGDLTYLTLKLFTPEGGDKVAFTKLGDELIRPLLIGGSMGVFGKFSYFDQLLFINSAINVFVDQQK